ncbi:MAG: alanine--tRNA ligase, partial [Planctomycetaceae bacterium]|nr:alanine--tRNA ligase [Planctomycetaceae bacterium]
FLGYETLAADAKVVGLIVDKQSVEKVPAGFTGPVGVVLDRTPCYGESGGQVGDSGTLSSTSFAAEICDTQKHQQTLFVHEVRITKGTLAVGDQVHVQVNEDRRAGIRRAHSATHILHHALHRTVGDSATQRGSKVEQDALRFDFAHKQALTADEIRQVEDIINQQIASGAVVTTELLPIADARKRGAMALFGEKYPDNVRVVTMGNFSVELCGGTHLTNTGQIGLCRIVSEEPVAKGVRRITAITGPRALQKGREADELVAQLQRLLKATQPSDLITRVESLQAEVRQLKSQLAEFSSASVAEAIGELVSAAEEVSGVRVIARRIDGASREMLRDYVDQLRESHGPVAVVLGAEIEGKVALIAAVSKALVKEKNLHAGNAVKAAATTAGGGGGGRPDMAEAGARHIEKLDEAIAAGAAVFRAGLGG